MRPIEDIQRELDQMRDYGLGWPKETSLSRARQPRLDCGRRTEPLPTMDQQERMDVEADREESE
jgi:hypothetical protein